MTISKNLDKLYQMSVKLKNKVVTASIENPTLFKEALDCAQKCFDKLNSLLSVDLKLETSEPIVMFKDSKTGGYVWPQKFGNRVFLNWVLLKENKEDYINGTIPHEVCHIFQRHLYPRSSSHGVEWKRLMQMVGLEPKRCHSYDVQNAGRDSKKATFTYICKCQKHQLSAIKNRRFLTGVVGGYNCRKCKTSIVPLSDERPKFVGDLA